MCILLSPILAAQQLLEKNASFYGSAFSPDIVDKLKAAPAAVIQYLCKMDNVTNYKNHELTQGERDLFLEYYSFLPEMFQMQISEKVVAIYIIDGFPFGGMADYAFDEKGEMYSVLYINAKVFTVSLSEWLTERDNSPFDKNTNKSIVVDCGAGYKGLLHTLVHEACHIYDYYNHATPYAEPHLKGSGTSRTQFVAVWDDYFTPVKAYRNRDVQRVNYWGFGKKTTIDTEKKLIDYLNKSPFSSVYGAKNWADDYAETYTYYFLKEKFNIEYKIMYQEMGVTKKTYIPTNNPLVTGRYAW